MPVEQKTPTFSLISVIKNVAGREAMFRRSIESVLGQTFADFEYVIQDGGSTDATAQIVAEYQDPRIQFLSVPDSCGEEGFFRSLKRCRGTYVGSCLSDEELLPDALENARRVFQDRPHLAAFYGNVCFVDEEGKKWGPRVPPHPFSIEAYVCQVLVPPFCSSFFRRDSIERAGLRTHAWRYGVGEFEFWIRLAGTGEIIYAPCSISHFGVHATSSTATAATYDGLLRERVQILPALFEENSILRNSRVNVDEAIAGNYQWAAKSVLPIEGASKRYEHFARQAALHAAKARHYHIEHEEGWTPESHRDRTLDTRLDEKRIDRLANKSLRRCPGRMRSEQKPLIFNDAQWGLANDRLAEEHVTVADWERPTPADAGIAAKAMDANDGSTDVPYLSLVVTTRNDDHGGNQLQRLQVFLDHLADTCDRHKLAAELIVVEWNPDPSRPSLAEAMRWPDPSRLPTRIIVVPPEIHQAHRHADRFPLFQMLAKNVGIRRARGEYVLATNMDILFSDELAAWLARRELQADCFYRIDRHDVGEAAIPQGLSGDEVLEFCAPRVVRVHGQHGTYASGQQPPVGDPQRLHTNACGDFTLMARTQWERLKGYPEFPLWSIYLDGLLLHAARAAGLKQKILGTPLRIYHIEHSLGWAVTEDTIAERPSLDYQGEYLPLCRKMLETKKPLDINKVTWGLVDVDLEEIHPAADASGDPEGAVSPDGGPETLFAHWIDVLGAIDNRLYYRDQSAQSLVCLGEIARQYDPTVIVELGTLDGLSLRAWLTASQRARVVAIDLSFARLAETRRVLPADLSRVTLLEQDILKTDIARLWTSQNRVILFVDAHDLPNVPIMSHVLTTALPSLPDGSMVIVDDLWFSEDRLTPDNARSFFEGRVLGEIDELQCFTGHYAPYHAGGSFMGFAEVVPLLEFVNEHGVELVFDRAGKHVFLVWDRKFLSRRREPTRSDSAEFAGCWGSVAYNPLESVPAPESLAELMHRSADAYRRRKIKEVVESLSQTAAQHPRNEALSYGLAVCLARLGMLSQARDILGLHANEIWHPRCRRLFDDLVHRVGPFESKQNGQSRQPATRCGLTMFAMPKAFVGPIGIIQKNAIRSWARLEPAPEIILFGDEPGTKEMAEEIGARHIPEVGRNEFGTPLVDKLFQAAEHQASHDVLAYVNADIILFPDFRQAVQKVQEGLCVEGVGLPNANQGVGDPVPPPNRGQDARDTSNFLLIGQRWDLPVLDEIDFRRPQWREEILGQMQEHAMLHAECGLDYFLFRKGCWSQIPPFAIGRTAWDNWLVMAPGQRGVPVIDGTEFITAVHQDHDYGHMAGGRSDAWHGVEATRNRSLAGTVGNSGRTSGTTWVLHRDGALVRVEEREAQFLTWQYKAERSDWLLQQARRLMGLAKQELAACKCEEAIDILDKLLASKQKGSLPHDLTDPNWMAERYVAACSLLAQCCMQSERHEEAAAVYARLLADRRIRMPAPLRDSMTRARDQLAGRLQAKKDEGERKEEPENAKTPLARSDVAVLPPCTAPSAPADSAAASRPKVTVITACRDGEKHLAECIESVLKQTLPDWELLLLDDGSTDGTRRIMQDYARRDSRIHACCFDDSAGPYVRRNDAIERAASPFIVIQDADDVMCRDKLERLYGAISRDDRLGIVGSFYRTFLDGFEDLQHTEEVRLATSQEEILKAYRTCGVCDWCWHGSAIIRKRLFDEIGLYDRNLFGSDSFLLGKAAEYACRSEAIRLENIPELLTSRRMHAESQISRLPVFDPRSRRVLFSAYRRKQLAELAARLDTNPSADIKAELRKTACDDFGREFGYLFAPRENLPVTSEIVDLFLARVYMHFAKSQFIRCIVTCGVVERLVEDIPRIVRCYDLVRGAAYFALGLPEQSREFLMREFRTHGTRRAREFCADYIDRYDPAWNRSDRMKAIRQGLFRIEGTDATVDVSVSVARLLLDRRDTGQVELSLVVPRDVDAESWTQCAKALNGQTRKDFEVIVLTRDGSGIEAQSLVSELGPDIVVLAAQEQANPWLLKNAAVNHARGRYVVFLGEGVLPEARFVETVLQHFARHDVSGLRGRVLSDCAAPPVSFDLGPEAVPAACDVDEMCAFRKDVFLRLGGYARTPFTRGAIHLSYRLYTDQDAARRPILYGPDIVVRRAARREQPCDRQVDPFALENRLCIDYLLQSGYLSEEEEPDLQAFLTFVKSLYPTQERTGDSWFTQVLSNSLFFEKRFPALAAQWAERALTLRPDSLRARYALGAAQASLNRLEQAAMLLETILVPLETLLAKGRIVRGQSEFTDFASVGDCYVAACTLLAQCHTRMQRYEQVGGVYVRLLENPWVSLPTARREGIVRVLKALQVRAEDLPAAPAPQHEVLETARTSCLRGESEASATQIEVAEGPFDTEPAETPAVHTVTGEYDSVCADLERKFKSMPTDTQAKHTLAIRISELARRTGLIEKSRVFQTEARKIRNMLEFNRARPDRPAVCRHKPAIVEVNVIARCNAGCIMCDYTPEGDILPLDRFKAFADALLPTAREALLIGGEVLLHPDFYNICAYAHRFGVLLDMTTNLHTLAGDRAEAVRRFFGGLRVSLDAATKQTYESIRTHLSFERLLKNLDVVSEIRRQRPGFRLRLAFAAMRPNIHELPDTIELAGRYGFDSIAVSFVQVRHRLRLDDSLLFHRELANQYFDLARAKAAGLGMSLDIPANFDLSRPPYLRPESPTEGHKQCVRPWHRVRVLVNGEVIPCCHLHSLPMGNVLEQPFGEIWTGREYQELREAIRTGSNEMPERCKHCQIVLQGTDSNDAMLHIGSDHAEEMKARLAGEAVTPRVKRSAPVAGLARPKVTVVTACYNSEGFLPACLDSIRNQTLQEWELLLVDDGSTDGTREIIERYSRMDPRIKASRFDTNEGPYVRRQGAIQRANSEFIVIQDSDDLMSPVKLERLYAEITGDPRLAVVASFYRTFVQEFRGVPFTDLIALPIDSQEIVERCVSWRHPFSHGSAIIRREMFEHIGPYDRNPFASDSFWSAKLGEYIRQGAPWRIRGIPECLTFVRVHGTGQTQRLPMFDPRSRRSRYRCYCEHKLQVIREKMRKVPGTDIGRELRECDCSDFLIRFKAMILTWENEPLAEAAIPTLLANCTRMFQEDCYVSCVSLLNGIEVMWPDIAKHSINFDLLKGIALYALDLQEHSRAQVHREIENHDNPAAKAFLADFFTERRDSVSGPSDVRRWCAEHGNRLMVGIVGPGPARNRPPAGPTTCGPTSEVHAVGR